MNSLDRLASVARSIVSRGRIVLTVLNPKRALIQVNILAGEVKENIELMLPYGMSANPPAGGDVLLFAVGGSRSHLIALCADDPALRIAGLAAGEFGFRDKNGQQIVFRANGIEITSTLGVTINADVTVNGKVTATGEITAKNTHTVSAHTHTDPQGGSTGTPTG